MGEFSDFLTECLDCNEASRADHLVEEFYPNADSLTKGELAELIETNMPKCPSCGGNNWGELKSQNLMFDTKIGVGSSARDGFLRPETAQGMFTSFFLYIVIFVKGYRSVQYKPEKVTGMK